MPGAGLTSDRLKVFVPPTESAAVLPINVKDPAYGAVGDANATASTGHDDTAAINAAVAAATAGGTVFFPRGYYKLTGAINVDLDDVTLDFEAGARLILAANSNTNVIRGNTGSDTNTTGTTRKNRFVMRGGYIDMQGASQSNTAGIDGCIVLPNFEYVRLENVLVHNSKNVAFECRGSRVTRFLHCSVDGVYYGNNGNGFNVGQTGSTVGLDAEFTDCHASGVADVAFWLGGYGAHRIAAKGCHVRGDATRYFTDGAISSGSGAFTSARAAFTANDVAKTITVNGAGAAGVALTCRISSFTSATSVGLSVNASTTVTGATFSYAQDSAPARQVCDAAITSGASTLTSNTASFTSADINRGVYVRGAAAGGADARGLITAVGSATSATVDFTAGATVVAPRSAADGVTNATTTFTSATAAFTTTDTNKRIVITGSGPAGADLSTTIASVTNATTVVLATAATDSASSKSFSIVGGTAIINTTNSGVSSEGSNGNSTDLSISGCHVVGTVNVGIGVTDASSGTVVSKHDRAAISNSTVHDSYGTGLWVTGTQMAVTSTTVSQYHGTGVSIGSGPDVDEYAIKLFGVNVDAAYDATSVAVNIAKTGSFTNFLRDVELHGCNLSGNAGGTYGVRAVGKVKYVTVFGGTIEKFKNSGVFLGVSGGSSPVTVKFSGTTIKNNNQAVNAAGQNSAGVACESAVDDPWLVDCTVTDDQSSKTQTHALHYSSATRGKFMRNDFRGNLTGPLNVGFDTKTVYRDNIEVDDIYEGEATLVAGTVTVSTTAVRNTPAVIMELSHKVIGGTPGALYVSARTNNTSFDIKSTSGTDTSTVKWRIR